MNNLTLINEGKQAEAEGNSMTVYSLSRKDRLYKTWVHGSSNMEFIDYCAAWDSAVDEAIDKCVDIGLSLKDSYKKAHKVFDIEIEKKIKEIEEYRGHFILSMRGGQ